MNRITTTNQKAIPDGNGNGKCLACGKKVEADEYGYYGNREARFYCRKHLKEFYKKNSKKDGK